MWTPALERALLDELSVAWHTANQAHFKQALRAPVLRLEDHARTLGTWERRSRTLTLSRPLVAQARWGQVVEVLKHEMAHQYVDEVLAVHDETAHGPAFQRVCARMGIDAAATGLPAAAEDASTSKGIRRIRKLLALAESPNRHEAEAAARRAHRMLLEHDLAAVQAGEPRRYGSRELGEPSERIPAHERILAGLIARFFFVEAIWVPGYVVADGRRGRVLEITGTPENLEVAAWVHAFVTATADSLWRRYQSEVGAPGGERRRFLSGVMSGFSEQLAAGTREAAEAGLVHVGDPGLRGWIGARYPRLRSVRTSVVASDAWHAGRSEGRGIVLHKPIAEGPSGKVHRLGSGR